MLLTRKETGQQQIQMLHCCELCYLSGLKISTYASFKSGGMTFPRSDFAGVMSYFIGKYSVNIDHVKSGYNQTCDTK